MDACRASRDGHGPRAVLALRGLDQTPGMTSAELANATARRASSAHTVLRCLAALGALGRAKNERPTRWRRALA